MEHLIIPKGYTAPLTIRETEVAIKEIKDHFERALAKSLHLTRVSAPLFVKPESERQLKWCGTSSSFWDQRAERHPGGNCTFPCKMETLCIKALWFSLR